MIEDDEIPDLVQALAYEATLVRLRIFLGNKRFSKAWFNSLQSLGLLMLLLSEEERAKLEISFNPPKPEVVSDNPFKD